MSYDDQNGKMDWKDESIWILISLISGSVLSIIFIHSNKSLKAAKIINTNYTVSITHHNF
jgi:hypothetical protein